MSDWPGAVSAITLFVDDLAAARDFYESAFGLPVHYQDEESAVFAFGGTLVNLLVTSAADEVIAPARVGGADAGARSVMTLTVVDVDRTCAELRSRGVQLLNGPMDRPWGVRTASFGDPAGHIWELAQPVG